MHRVAWLSGVWLLGALACGSSSGGGPASGAAGSPGAGNAGAVVNAGAGSGGAGAGNSSAGTSGAAGSANGGVGGAVFGDSKAEACIAYVSATCARREECEGRSSTADCLLNGFNCPDVVFSDGSTRTVAALQACAAAYKTLPCDKVLKDELPDCVTPGTRAEGAACTYASQCATLECKFAPAANCGVCAKLAKHGDACTAADVDCDTGLVCTAGVCVYDGSILATVGDSCQTDTDCPGLDCASGSHTCVAPPTLGMSCAEHKHCSGLSYCEGTSLLCTALPSAGAQCGYDAAYKNLQDCAYDSTCNPQLQPPSANCAKIPGIGEPCLKNTDNGETLPECADGAYCDTTLTSPQCVALHTVGGSCSASRNECAPGLDCRCPDGGASCMPPFTCIAYRFKGEPCGTPGAICFPSFTCTNGACQPIDSNGTFAKECPASN
jgi:hypothetical protein